MGYFPSEGTMRPQSPPPSYRPSKPSTSYIIDCIYQYTYVWLKNGEQFWFYPTRVEYEGATGYRWNGAVWVYYAIDARNIDAVACPPIPTPY